MVSQTGDTCGKDLWERPVTEREGTGREGTGSVKGRVRHLPIPELPRPLRPPRPQSKPIAIPKKLTARRMGRSLSVTWDSQLEGEANILDPRTSGPRGFKEGPIFVFPSVDRKVRDEEWLWPGEVNIEQEKDTGSFLTIEQEKRVHPPFLTIEQKGKKRKDNRRKGHRTEGKEKEGGGEETVRKWQENEEGGHQPLLRPGNSGGQGSLGHGILGIPSRFRPKTPPRPPIRSLYTAPFSDQGDGMDLKGVAGSGGLGAVFRSEGMEAPIFLNSFMPIPRFMDLEMDDLPLDLSKISL
jgi:hypothetical protein